jgi:hypothetical protein
MYVHYLKAADLTEILKIQTPVGNRNKKCILLGTDIFSSFDLLNFVAYIMLIQQVILLCQELLISSVLRYD